MSVARHTQVIKRIAQENNFSFCGISKAEFLEDEAPKLEQWLKRGYHGKMQYMENHFDKRLDPTKLVPGAKSVVSLIYNYYSPSADKNQSTFKIAKYAKGEDYHVVIKDKLKILLDKIREEIGEVEGRIFVDSAPVMERQWAAKSGIGWLGKNSLLLNKQTGSFFFLAELIIDLELEPDAPTKDYCGTCTACIDACPTDAITEPYVIDSNKCISYLTIELKESIPSEFQDKMDNWIFGCDVCQDVCPWNRFSSQHTEPRFNPAGDWQNFRKQEWIELTEEIFNKNFSKSALTRTGYNGLLRNIRFSSKKEKN